MRRILPPLAILSTIIFAASPAFSALIVGHTAPDLGPTTVTVVTPSGTNNIVMDSGVPTWNSGVDPTDPETNYWIVPTTSSSYTIPGVASVHDFTQSFDLDPIIGLSGHFDNDSGVPMVVTVSKTVNVGAWVGPLIYKGTIGITLTDFDGGGATVSSNGVLPVYTASIDGNPLLTIYNSPFSFSVGDSVTDTLPFNSGFLPTNLSINSTMTISLTFVVSPNDSVGVTSNFTVLPPTGGGVPEPASLGLLGVGALGLLRRRR